MIFRGRAVAGTLLLVILLGASGACDRGTEPEPEDPNILVAQPLLISATAQQELANELNQSVAPLSDGGFAIVWMRGAEIGERHVMTQWLDSRGNLRRPDGPLRVTSYLDQAGDSVVTARRDGGAYVAFSQVDGMAFQVKVQAFDENMTPLWTAPVRAAIHAGGWESQGEPSLAPAPSGGAFVSFNTCNERDGWGIKCQHIDPLGARAWGDEGIVLGAHYGFVSFPKAVADGSGGVYVFWLNLGHTGAPIPEMVRVEGQHLDGEGNKLWGDGPLLIHATHSGAVNGYSYTDYSAAADGLGGAVVACYDDLDHGDGQIDVLAQRVNAAGELLWGQGVLPGDASRDCQPDGIIAGTDGGAFVSYREWVSESVSRLWMQRLGANGEKQWGEKGSELSDPNAPRMTYSAYGHFTGSHLNLCWTRQASPYTFDFDVMMGRFKKDGTAMDPLGGMVIDDSDDKQFTRGMAYNPVSESYFTLWEDSRRSRTWDDFDIYGAVLRKAASAAAAPLSRSAPPAAFARRQADGVPFRDGKGMTSWRRAGRMPGERTVRWRDRLMSPLPAKAGNERQNGDNGANDRT